MALSERTRAILGLGAAPAGGPEDLVSPPSPVSPRFSRRTRSLLGLDQPPPEEPLLPRIGRAALEAAGTAGEVVSTPFRGLGMLATAAQEAALGTPIAGEQSRIRLTAPAAEGGPLRDIYRPTATSPSTPELVLEGLGMATGAREVDVNRPGGIVPIEEDVAQLAARRGPVTGPVMAVAEPFAETGLMFGTDPALAGFEALSKARAAGKLTAAALEAGEVLPDTALQAAAQRAVLLGKAAGAVEAGVTSSYVPGMVGGAIAHGRAAVEAAREHGITSPEALRPGASALIDTAMAASLAKHTVMPEGVRVPIEGGATIPATEAVSEAQREMAGGIPGYVHRSPAFDMEFGHTPPDQSAIEEAAARRKLAAETVKGLSVEDPLGFGAAAEQRTREFQTPDREAMAAAEQARRTREFLQNETLQAGIEGAMPPPGPQAPRLAGEPDVTLRGEGADLVNLSPAAQEAAGVAPVPQAARTIEQARIRRAQVEAAPAEEFGRAIEAATAAPPAPPRLAGGPGVRYPGLPARQGQKLPEFLAPERGAPNIAPTPIRATSKRPPAVLPEPAAQAPPGEAIRPPGVQPIAPPREVAPQPAPAPAIVAPPTAPAVPERPAVEPQPVRLAAAIAAADRVRNRPPDAELEKLAGYHAEAAAGQEQAERLQGAIAASDRLRARLPDTQLEELARYHDRAAIEAKVNESFPPLTPTGEGIGSDPDLAPDQKAVEQRAREQVLGNIDASIDRYKNGPMPDKPEGYGNVLNTDDVRTMFPDYLQDRSRHAASVHEPASALTREMFRRALIEHAGDGGDVVMTAGGTGSGKSTAAERIPGVKAVQDNALLVYDSNLNNFKTAKRRIDAVLASGNKVKIVDVWRDPVEALVDGMLPRAMRQEKKLGSGRAVPLKSHADTNLDVPETLVRVAEEYKGDPRVQIEVIRNKTGEKPQLVEDPIAFLKSLPYYGSESTKAQYVQRFREALEAERKAGRISEAVYNGVLGGEAPVEGNRAGHGEQPRSEPQAEAPPQLKPRPPPEAVAAPEQPTVPKVPAPIAAEAPRGPERPARGEGEPTRPVSEQPVAPKERGLPALLDTLADRLSDPKPMDNRELTALASEALGGTRGAGTFSARDAYDVLETAVNRKIQERGAEIMKMEPAEALQTLRNTMKRLPVQADRTKEQVDFQQFSTPPTEAYVAAKSLGIRPDDTVLEPSAGNGGLAVFAQAAGAGKVLVNEIAPRRVELLKALGFEPTTVDAEQLNNLLPDDVKPTAILMNPPFSATGGRVLRHKTEYGARHIEQALLRLQPGGRLVGIVGQGMALGKPGFSQWWQKIGKQYDVRANVGVSGKEYAKYGTTFGNQIVVIDKTTNGTDWSRVVKASNATLEEALRVLEPVKADRPIPTAEGNVEAARGGGEPGGRGGRAPAEGGGGELRPGRAGGAGVPQPERPAGGVAALPEGEPGPQLEPAEAPRPGGERPVPAGGGRTEGARPERPVAPEPAAAKAAPPADPEAPHEARPVDEPQPDGLDKTFVAYTPTKLKEPGARKHPGKIVEAASMAAVDPPDITYKPNLPKETLPEARLSDIGYETVSYIGQRHSQMLPDGVRAGHFVGDGPGVGKGRVIAGTIYDNWRQGRKRSVWVSFGNDLMSDAIRDRDDVGAKEIPMKRINDWQAAADIDMPNGTIFTTYSTLISAAKGEKGQKRLDQLLKWKPDVIVFDEAHKAKNLLASGPKGEGTQTGRAVVDLQAKLPDSRVLYSSATGATDVRNMAYMTRLGLWGKGTPFATFPDFWHEIEGGGVGAMEMVARDMKALGMYVSRSISYDGVEYAETKHDLAAPQHEMYDSAAGAWQHVIQNVDKVLETTHAGPRAAMAARSAFWGSQQRFFNLLITAFKVPSTIKKAEEALKRGESVVIALKNTGEARTGQKVTEAIAEGASLDDLDFSPTEILVKYIEKSFPTAEWTEIADPNNPEATIRVPLTDKDGNVVHNKEALKAKQKLLDDVASIKLPDNPLDQIINHFGADQVAELTGRQKRLIIDEHTGKREYKTRAGKGIPADKVNLSEMSAFQGGKKRVAVISQAASTGISLHADNRAKNQQRRYHIVLQVGWAADQEIQGLGRTHRTNQKSAPMYDFISSNVGGERRFTSTIAKRLASMGALSRGSRDAAAQGDIAKYNFESKYGEAATAETFSDLFHNDVEGLDGRQVIKDMGLAKGAQGNVGEKDARDVPRFLNRILALDVKRQNLVFEHFMAKFGDAVQSAKDLGTFDDGVTDVKGLAIRSKGEPTLVHTHEQTGAQTKHYTVEVDQKTKPVPWDRVLAAREAPQDKGGGGEFYKTGERVSFMQEAGTRTHPETGAQVQMVQLTTPREWHTKLMPSGEFYSKAVRLTDKAAEEMWTKAVDAIPPISTKDVHVLGGAITPLWDRLKAAKVTNSKVVRVQTDDGQRIVGLRIPRNRISAVMRELGISKAVKDPESAWRQVWEDQQDVDLTAGMKLRSVSIHGEPRVEVMPYSRSQIAELREIPGVFSEIINSQTRFFVPNVQEKALAPLETILKRWPAMEQKPTGPAPAVGRTAGDAALERLKARGQAEAYDLGSAVGAGAAAWRDVTIYGAHLIGQGFRKFATWSGRMLEDLGGTIRDLSRYLRSIWSRSTEESRRAPMAPEGVSPAPQEGPSRPPSGPPGTPPPRRPTAAPAAPAPPPRPLHERLAEDAVTLSNRAARIADTFEATNRKIEQALAGAERIEERGTIAPEERVAFRAGGQPERSETAGFRFSEKDISQAGAELVAAAKEFYAVEQRFRTSGDPDSAAMMKVARQVVDQAARNWQVYRSSAGRAVQRFNRAIPADVINRLREAQLIAGNLTSVKEKVPIATNILQSLKRWDSLTDAEKKQFGRDLVDHFRLNLFSVTSWTLDAVGNLGELGGQVGAGLGRDLVHVAKGDVSFPSMQGMWRAIRAKAPMRNLGQVLEEGLDTTIGGERIGRRPGAGIFTYRGTLGSKIYDYVVGGPLYAKQALDTGAKRMGALATVYRDAIEAGQKQGLRGGDLEQYIDRFVENIPADTIQRALANGKKAGFSRDLSKWEEAVGSSTTARLLVDTFARWPFQFARWGAEMLGWRPDLFHKMRAGTLTSEEVGEYLGKVATGLGALYLINQLYDRTDFNSMEYVRENGDRIRLSNRDPIPTALWFLSVMKGDTQKATASLRHASVPFARLLAGQGGLLGGTIQAFLQAAENPQNDPRALKREFEDTINRAFPGQAVLSALKTAFDPVIREGVGANLPLVSRALPAAVDPSTGRPLESRQRVFGVELPSIAGTPIPGATRVIQPVQKLLARFGLQVYRGPRAPVAGYPPGAVPEELRREWQEVFGQAREKVLAPLTRYALAAQLSQHAQDAIRKEIQSRDRIAAAIADREMRRRHGGPRKLERQPTRRELAAPDVFHAEKG